MKLTMVIGTLALIASAAATAQFTTIQRAHEVRLSTVRLPTSIAGSLGFKPCDGCDIQAIRVSGETRWLFNNQ
ncbi:MAG: hypothetical protein R3288_16175, partial [Woeseiaceae bacterium]|nr:hypothetical protein [Woeseiaceae bacterium]